MYCFVFLMEEKPVNKGTTQNQPGGTDFEADGKNGRFYETLI